jgi:nitrate reductase NapE component
LNPCGSEWDTKATSDLVNEETTRHPSGERKGASIRFLVTALVALILVPVLVVGAIGAATAILSEWFDFRLFDFSDIGVLDWLFGGPGAGANSFENYVTFMVFGIPALASFAGLTALWQWARRAE